MLFIKTIRFLWPFLQEMFLGDKTLRVALRLYLGRLLVIGVFLVSLGLNFVVVPRLLEISYSHVELKRKYTALMKQCWPNSDPYGVPEKHEPAAPAATPQPSSTAPVTAAEQYRLTQEWLHKLQGESKTQ